MKKKLISISIIILVSIQLQGQNFISTEKEWNVRLTGWANTFSTETFKIYGDSIIDSVHYKKIWASFDSLVSWNFQGLLREDSNIVYYIPPNSSEGILYDFSLEIGETIFVKNIFCDDFEVPITVIDIDTIEYFGVPRKRWHLGEDGYTSEYWVNGIGSLNGPLYTNFDYYMVCPVWELLCYHESENLCYMLPGQTDCYVNTVGIKESFDNQKIIVKPNPARKGETINIEIGFQPKRIELFNGAGNHIKNTISYLDSKVKIETNTFEKGLYLIRVTDQENKVQTLKIVIK